MQAEEIREWIENPQSWPTDSYDLATLEPSATLARREAELRGIVPEWFWTGEPGAVALSIGAGKGYFERKYWGGFDKVYLVDPADQTRLGLVHFPIANGEFLNRSIFPVAYRLPAAPKYGWMGACIHYLFAEFHGWEFMHKLAMLVSDTLVIDAGVFDADSTQGRYFTERWPAEAFHERYRHSQFSYDCFLREIAGVWEVVSEHATGWTEAGRRTLVLKRVLPPAIQKAELGELALVVRKEDRAIYRVRDGYYKEYRGITPLLVYDVVSKAMGWPDMVRWAVYDGDRFAGLVVKDYGDESPATCEASEQLHLALCSRFLPLGLLPADVARENIRMHGGEPVWIDIDLAGLRELDARGALWVATNIYKQYRSVPAYIKRAIPDAKPVLASPRPS